MTRKQAELYCRIPKSDIGDINRGYEKNYDAMRAYAFGATLQSRSRFNPKAYWEHITEPSFEECFEYRIAEDDTFPVYPAKTSASIDGVSLSEGELALIRALRKIEYIHVFGGEIEVIDWKEKEVEIVAAAISTNCCVGTDKDLVDALQMIKEEKEAF